MQPILELKDVYKTFTKENESPLHVIDKLNLQVYENEFICLLGPSGSGKSTILRLISALDTPDKGEILYGGKPYVKPSSSIGFVFQDYSLMPWLTVKENIQLGLKFSKKSKEEQEKVTQHYISLVGLKKFTNAKIYELSGGMQQRVAIARSLANNPDIILMDEPFGALDAFTRIILQRELLKIWSEEKKTVIFVTHSVEEAVFLADRIILLSNQTGNIYEEVEVELERERDRASQEFNEISKYLLSQYEYLSLGDEHQRSEDLIVD